MHDPIRKPPPKEITVLIDSREQYPLLFPGSIVWHPWQTPTDAHRIIVHREVTTMPEGDYGLKGMTEHCLVERKGSLSELSTNLLTQDRARTLRALERMASATKRAYLLVDESVPEMMAKPRRQFEKDPELMIDNLIRVLNMYDISLICLGKARSRSNRMRVGTFVLHLMINFALIWTGGSPCQKLPRLNAATAS